MSIEQEIELLRELRYHADEGRGSRDGWARPMDIGGSNASNHSYILRNLVKKELAEKRTRGSNRSFEYRITEQGRVILNIADNK
jgi:hypothetical protein